MSKLQEWRKYVERKTYQILSQRRKVSISETKEKTADISNTLNSKRDKIQSVYPIQDELPLGLPKPEDTGILQTILNERKRIIEQLLDPELTLRETAIILSISKATLRRYADKGLISYIRTPTNQRRFKLSAILDFQEKRKKLNLDKILNIDEPSIYYEEEIEGEQDDA